VCVCVRARKRWFVWRKRRYACAVRVQEVMGVRCVWRKIAQVRELGGAEGHALLYMGCREVPSQLLT
jgi:hypothetical protein